MDRLRFYKDLYSSVYNTRTLVVTLECDGLTLDFKFKLHDYQFYNDKKLCISSKERKTATTIVLSSTECVDDITIDLATIKSVSYIDDIDINYEIVADGYKAYVSFI